MPRFVLETLIAAPPAAVFAASLDPELHVRSMARHGESIVEAPAGGSFTEGSTVTWRARHFGVPFRSPFGPLGRIVDALFLGAYMRRLISERNTILAAEIEDPRRTLSA